MAEKIGRSGLGEIDVTPAVYLQLLDQLEAGKEVAFRRAQLDLAFAVYLANHKGAWQKSQAKDLAGLQKFAASYVTQQREKLRKEQRNSALPLAAQQKKTQAAMEARGLAPLAQQDLPANLQDDALTPQAREMHALDHAETALTVAETLLDLAASSGAGPGTALIMIAADLAPDLGVKCIEALGDKYRNRAQTKEEKEICLFGLKHTAGPDEEHALQKTVRDLQQKETDPEFFLTLEELKGKPKPEKPLRALFEENRTLTKRPVFAAPTFDGPQTKQPASPFDLSKGPSFNWEAWEAEKSR